MVNVPSGVWIDEQGFIVRPAETAYSKGGQLLGKQLGDPRYAQGVRDWVKNGKNSKWILSKEQLKKKLALKSPKKQLAEAHFRMGIHFHNKKDKARAKKHWIEAQKLHPDNWNFHRQAWLYEGLGGQMKFIQKVRKLGDKQYYEPLDAPRAKDKSEEKDRPKTGDKKKRRDF
jgi:hypothetical protein